jgi:hypothetical protein
MGFRHFIYFIGLGALAFKPVIAAKPSKAEQNAISATIEQISRGVNVTGIGQLDPDMWISTQPFFKTLNGDVFARAVIQKKTMTVTYQLYFVTASRSNALRPKRLTFNMPEGLTETTLSRVSFDPSCSRYGCTIYEDSIGTFTRAQFDYAASQAVDGAPKVWQMKIFGDSTEGLETNILASEIAGLLKAVDLRLLKMRTP